MIKKNIIFFLVFFGCNLTKNELRRCTPSEFTFNCVVGFRIGGPVIRRRVGCPFRQKADR